MFESIKTALSGLIAAQNRIAAVATNVANANDVSRTQPQAGDPPVFQPIDTVETSTAGGVISRFAPVKPATVTVPDGTSPLADSQGLVNLPNVDLATQFLNAITAKVAFEANAKVIVTAQKMNDALLAIGTDKKHVDIKA
ncbi:MAG TPA: flagellar basal body rod C-terminal domain-containing protein [Alphaproteobacteria bacterium]